MGYGSKVGAPRLYMGLYLTILSATLLLARATVVYGTLQGVGKVTQQVWQQCGRRPAVRLLRGVQQPQAGSTQQAAQLLLQRHANVNILGHYLPHPVEGEKL